MKTKLLTMLLSCLALGVIASGCTDTASPATIPVTKPTFPQATMAPPPTSTITPAPTLAPTVISRSRTFRFSKPPTMDWQIVDSQTIVVATLTSATAGTEATDDTPARYRPAHVLQFRSSQYLKGTGPDLFTVTVVDQSGEGYTYATESSALAEANRTLAARNTEWGLSSWGSFLGRL